MNVSVGTQSKYAKIFPLLALLPLYLVCEGGGRREEGEGGGSGRILDFLRKIEVFLKFGI
jgi:hypothetical protein